MNEIGDRIRENLITVFVCSECGGNLTLSYDDPPKKNRRITEGEPTGAAMRKSVIAINPCEQCKQPVNNIKSAVKTLIDFVGEDDV